MVFPVDPFFMNNIVYFPDRYLVVKIVLRFPFQQALLKAIKALSPTFTALSVSGSKSCSLIQKEKLRPTIRHHHVAMLSFKLKQTGDPCFMLEKPDDILIRIVNHSPVSHESTT